MVWQLRFGYALLIMLVGLSVATAFTLVSEEGDAGDLTNTAQIVDELIDLTDRRMRINGLIDSSSDVDMYRIHISIPEEFSAITIFDINFSSIEDSQLFLFDADGKGVCANEDDPRPSAPVPLYAALPQGSCQITEPGFYYLAISTDVRDPADSSGNEIFPDPEGDARRDILLPIDPDAVVNGWVDSSSFGFYLIELTGVNFPSPKCGDMRVAETDRTRTFSLDILDTDPDVTNMPIGIRSIEVLDNLTNIDYVEIPEGSVENRFPRTNDNGEIETGRTFPDTPPVEAITVGAFSPDKFADARGSVKVTNNVGGETTCPFGDVPAQDTVPPFCCYRLILNEEDPVIQADTEDRETGIVGFRFDFLRNVVLEIPEGSGDFYADGPVENIPDDRLTIVENNTTIILYDPPTRDTITIEARRRNPAERATAIVFVLDGNLECTGDTLDTCTLASNETECDPEYVTITIPEDGFIAREEISDLSQEAHNVVVQNKDPGVTVLALRANDGRLHAHRLDDNEVKTIDTEADMIEGDNTVRITGIGPPNSGATVIFSDRPLNLQTPETISSIDGLIRPQRQIPECED